MTTPTPFDGELAWDISTWMTKYRTTGTELDREGIESLTLFLTKSGYSKPRHDVDLSLTDFRNLLHKGQRAVEDILRGPRDPAST